MKAELNKGYDADRVTADIARLSQERNIGKKMDRFHLFMSKGIILHFLLLYLL